MMHKDKMAYSQGVKIRGRDHKQAQGVKYCWILSALCLKGNEDD